MLDVPILLTPTEITQAVAVAGTAEALAADGTHALGFALMAKKVGGDNVGAVYIGLSDLDAGVKEYFELAPGDVLRMSDLGLPDGVAIDLNDLYVDADNADDGVTGWYYAVPS